FDPRYPGDSTATQPSLEYYHILEVEQA
ncbi:unnamed protein product, partial [Allacma fusca]